MLTITYGAALFCGILAGMIAFCSISILLCLWISPTWASKARLKALQLEDKPAVANRIGANSEQVKPKENQKAAQNVPSEGCEVEKSSGKTKDVCQAPKK